MRTSSRATARREQDLLRRIEELEAAINGRAPRPEEETTPPSYEASGSRETASDTAEDTVGLPVSFRNEPPGPGGDSPDGGVAGPPESHGPEPDSRETAIAPDQDPPGEEEDEVDVLTREFWPWMKGKWDDINYAIHWYKRNRGEWTRQLKNARAARDAGERGQAGPEDRAEGHRRDHGRRWAELERTPVWDSSIPPDPDAGSLWSRVLEDLRPQVPRHAFRHLAETHGGRGVQRRPVHRGRPDCPRHGMAGTKDVPRIAERPGKGDRPRSATPAADPRGP